MNLFLVIVGAAVGAPARFIIDKYIRTFTDRPFGILPINVLGSFIIGVVFSSGQREQHLLAIGFAGAFTTWSTFILDIYLAYELKRYKEVAVNLILSLGLGLLAVWLGLQIAG